MSWAVPRQGPALVSTCQSVPTLVASVMIGGLGSGFATSTDGNVTKDM